MRDFGRGGVIVNIGSSSTSGGRPGQSAYASSKAGIQTLTEVLALEGKDYGENGYKEIKVTAMITTLWLWDCYSTTKLFARMCCVRSTESEKRIGADYKYNNWHVDSKRSW